MYTYIYIYICVYICIYIYKELYVYMHIHTYTYHIYACDLDFANKRPTIIVSVAVWCSVMQCDAACYSVLHSAAERCRKCC